MGDAFDSRKSIDFVGLDWTRKVVLEPLIKYKVHLITGNHDVYFKNSNKINSPELLLKDYQNIKTYSEPTEVNIGGSNILLLPWINSENQDKSFKLIKNTKAKVVMGHLELQGFRVNKNLVMEEHGLEANLFSNFKKVFSGHYHTRSDNGTVFYLGNPYEIYWGDVNDTRGFTIFDTETLEPLYKFSLGQPGSSFTFEVAQINGIPLDLIEEAKTRLDVRKVSMDKLLGELQKEKTYLERLNNEHIEAQQLAQKAKNEYLEKKERFEEKLKTQQETIEVNNKYINSGKKLKQFIDRFQAKNKKKDANKPLIDEIAKYISLEKGKIEETKRIEKLKTEIHLKKPISKRKKEIIERDEFERVKIKVGSTVKLISTKQSGTVDEINGELVTVLFGFMRMKVEKEKLMWVK